MDFKNAKELLKVCQEQDLSISAVMLQRELTEGEQDPEETDRKMDRVLEIMKSAASTPIHTFYLSAHTYLILPAVFKIFTFFCLCHIR